MSAVPLLDSVWLVGSGTHPDALTDPHDCHCYLIWDGAGGLLVDTGTGLGTRRWLAAVAEVCDPRALTGAVLTHYHADHAGGAAAARAAGIPLLAGAETAEALATGDEVRTSLAVARTAGVYPDGYRLAPATVDRVLAGGDTIAAGGLRVEVVAAPGHCDGHLVLLLSTGGRTMLFSGDCLFAGGRVSIQALHDCRLDRYAETVIGLAGRDVDTLLPGHGPFVLDAARPDIQAAARSFRRLVPPPNVLQPD
ncbi:MBL fold metallo-hydrolase [Phytohabitans sp. ZYX-F-186]|uniref:MBL fold metallo-hydrolase n=1 Tax=Phytohabitans maris TaxID=3071409 RepID=A0ABU0ZQU7_9ACTN|nr:MBL fold metallo-hydrolase [Phytohabitans sp. ZYX-F-186]MDQ7909408.1 MBL fold metallo-hydrolase [Phytohabitans sp. ZYX-F-186]